MPKVLARFSVTSGLGSSGITERPCDLSGMAHYAMWRCSVASIRMLWPQGYTATVIDGVHLELLHPSATFQPPTKRRGDREDAGENNRSLVLKLTYGAISFLFTGDIEQEAESVLLQTSDDLRATVLKVPHHGSRTSSSEPFVRAVDPSVAVFSVQRDSRFGHPHPMVVERYKALGVHLLRTDEHGAITVRTDGQSVWVEPYARQASGALRTSDPPLGGDAHATCRPHLGSSEHWSSGGEEDPLANPEGLKCD